MTESDSLANSLDIMRKIQTAVAVIIFGLLAWWVWSWLSHRKADAIAAAETRMWKAYYKRDAIALGLELAALLRSQFGLSYLQSIEVAKEMGSSAMKFQEGGGGDYSEALPELELAYGRLQALSGRSFDPREAARAELAWWVARRTPGDNSVEEVGGKIAELYAVLYGSSAPEFAEAGLLRAQAGRIRDLGGADCDWKEVEKLLRESYRVLMRKVGA